MRSAVACVLAVVLVLAGACSTTDSGGAKEPGAGDGSAQQEKKTYTVVYEATGQADLASITYKDLVANKEITEDTATFPWKKETTAESGDYVTMNVTPASDANSATDEVANCRITVNGQEVATNTDDTLAMCNLTLE